MKLKHIVIAFATVLIIVLAGLYSYDKSRVLETHESPDGNYVLIVKRSGSLFSFTMPGDGGKSMPVDLVLKDAQGNIIGNSSDTACGTLWFSIDVFWDVENNEVWYAKARTINLKTGEVSC